MVSLTSTPAFLPLSQRILKWIATIFLVIFVVVGGYIVLPILPALLVVVFMSGDSGNGFLVLLSMSLFVSPIIFLFVLKALFRNQKYLLVILLSLLAFGAIGFYFRDYLLARFEITASKVGISVPDEAPPGILNLPSTAIPKDYSLRKKGYVSGNNYYKDYYAHAKMGGDSDSIQFAYHANDCNTLLSTGEVQSATCKVGTCIVAKEIRDYGGDTRYAYFSYQIDDHGACAEVIFSTEEDKALTTEQRQSVVDSLVRISGERTNISFSEKTFVTLEKIRDALEHSKEIAPVGLYKKPLLDISPSNQGDCTSTPIIDISPDQQTFVIHQRHCPNYGMSYCIENGQTQISTIPTELVEKTYHCQ